MNSTLKGYEGVVLHDENNAPLLHTEPDGPLWPTTALQMPKVDVPKVDVPAFPWMWAKARIKLSALIRPVRKRGGSWLSGISRAPSYWNLELELKLWFHWSSLVYFFVRNILTPIVFTWYGLAIYGRVQIAYQRDWLTRQCNVDITFCLINPSVHWSFSCCYIFSTAWMIKSRKIDR
jgi:hypothetical protein